MAHRNEHPPCATELRKTFGDAVSTVPPNTPGAAYPFECPHGVTYWVELVREPDLRLSPRWLRYLAAIPLMALWVLLASVAVASSAWLALLCDAGVNTAITCGVVMFAAAAACTWPLMEQVVGWCEA